MMMLNLAVSSISDSLWRVVLPAADEILGCGGGSALVPRIAGSESLSLSNLDSLSSFEQLGALQRSLERTYGARAGRGLALRIGRSCFKYALYEFGEQLGLTSIAFRLRPMPERVQHALESLANLFTKTFHQSVRLEADDQSLRWVMERCSFCKGRANEEDADGLGACLLVVGLLQEMLYWVSGGRTFLVEETECVASGGRTCTITIVRIPLS